MSYSKIDGSIEKLSILDEKVLHSFEFWHERTSSILKSTGTFSESFSDRVETIIKNISTTYYLRERDEFLDFKKYNQEYWDFWVFENCIKLRRPNLNFNDVRKEVKKISFVVIRMMRKEYGVIEGENIIKNILRSVEVLNLQGVEFSDSFLEVKLRCMLTSKLTELRGIQINAGYGLKKYFGKDLFYPDPSYYPGHFDPYTYYHYKLTYQEQQALLYAKRKRFLTDFRIKYYSGWIHMSHWGINNNLNIPNINLTGFPFLKKEEDESLGPVWFEPVIPEDDGKVPPFYEWYTRWMPLRYWEDWPKANLQLPLDYGTGEGKLSEIVYAVKVDLIWLDHGFFGGHNEDTYYIWNELLDDDDTPPEFIEIRTKFEGEANFVSGKRYCGEIPPQKDLLVQVQYKDVGRFRASPLGNLKYIYFFKVYTDDTLGTRSGEVPFKGDYTPPFALNTRYNIPGDLPNTWEGTAQIRINKFFWDYPKGSNYSVLDRIEIDHEAENLDEESYTIWIPQMPYYAEPGTPEWNYIPYTRDDTLKSDPITTIVLQKVSGGGIAFEASIELEFTENLKEASKPYPGEIIGLYCKYINPQTTGAVVNSLSYAIVPKDTNPTQWYSYSSFQQIPVPPDGGIGNVFSPVLTKSEFAQASPGQYDIWIKSDYRMSGEDKVFEEKVKTYQVIYPEEPSIKYSATMFGDTISSTDSENFQFGFPYRTDDTYKPYNQTLKVEITNSSRVLLRLNSRNPGFIEIPIPEDPSNGIEIRLQNTDLDLIGVDADTDYLPEEIEPGSTYSIYYTIEVVDTRLIKVDDITLLQNIYLLKNLILLAVDLYFYYAKFCLKTTYEYLGFGIEVLDFLGSSVHRESIMELVHFVDLTKIRLNQVPYTFSNLSGQRTWSFDPQDYTFYDTIIEVVAVPSLGQLSGFDEWRSLLDLADVLLFSGFGAGLALNAIPGWGQIASAITSIGCSIGAAISNYYAWEALKRSNYIDPPDISYLEKVTIPPLGEILIPDIINAESHPKYYHLLYQLKEKAEEKSIRMLALRTMGERGTEARNAENYQYASMHSSDYYHNFTEIKKLNSEIKDLLMELTNHTIDYITETDIQGWSEIKSLLEENGVPQELINLLQKGNDESRTPGEDGYLSEDQINSLLYLLGVNRNSTVENFKEKIVEANESKELIEKIEDEKIGLIKDQYIGDMINLNEIDSTVDINQEPSELQIEELTLIQAEIHDLISGGFYAEAKTLCEILKNKANQLMFDLVNNQNQALNDFVKFADEHYFSAHQKEFINITIASPPQTKLEHNEKGFFTAYISTEKEHTLHLKFSINYQEFQEARISLNGDILENNTFDIVPDTVKELMVEFYFKESIMTFGEQFLILEISTDDEDFKDIIIKRLYIVELITPDDKLNSLITIDYQGNYTDAEAGVWDIEVEDPPGGDSELKVFIDNVEVGNDRGIYSVPNELGEHTIWVESKFRNIDVGLDSDTGLKTNTVKIYDDDSQKPVVILSYTGDGTDANPGAIHWVITDEGSGLSEIQIQVIYKATSDSTPNEITLEPSIEGKWNIPSDLGSYTVCIITRDADSDRTLLIDSLSVEVKETIQIIDDDTIPPVFSNVEIIVTINEININFDAVDESGIGNIRIYIGGELIEVLTTHPPNQTHFEYKYKNRWLTKIAVYPILIEVWDSDDDRDRDALKTEFRGSFEINLELMKSYVISSLETLLNQILEVPEEFWIKNSKRRKERIKNRVIILKNLIMGNEFLKAYNFLLRSIKPKLTGLTQDEEGMTIGLFAFGRVWITDRATQQELADNIDPVLNYCLILQSQFILLAIANRPDRIKKMWPTHDDISLSAYFTSLYRKEYIKLLELNGEILEITKIHYDLAHISNLLQTGFSKYLEIVEKPYFRIELPSTEVEGVNEVIIEKARVIRDYNLKYEFLDWFLAENTLLLEKLSQPYLFNVHIDELYLLPMLDEVTINILLNNGIDSLILLNDLNKRSLKHIEELKNLKFRVIKAELLKLKWF